MSPQQNSAKLAVWCFLSMLAPSASAITILPGDLIVIGASTDEFVPNPTLIKVSPTNGVQKPIPSSIDLRDPVALTIEEDGNLVVIDRASRSIVRIDPETEIATRLSGLVAHSDPVAIEVGLGGDLYYADRGLGAIVRVDRETGLQQIQLTSPGEITAFDVWVDPVDGTQLFAIAIADRMFGDVELLLLDGSGGFVSTLVPSLDPLRIDLVNDIEIVRAPAGLQADVDLLLGTSSRESGSFLYGSAVFGATFESSGGLLDPHWVHGGSNGFLSPFTSDMPSPHHAAALALTAANAGFEFAELVEFAVLDGLAESLVSIDAFFLGDHFVSSAVLLSAADLFVGPRDIVRVPNPEPSTALLVLMGTAALSRMRSSRSI